MLGDFLRESPMYREAYQKAYEEGLDKGYKEDIQQILKPTRNALLDITLARFPEIVHLAKKTSDSIDDLNILMYLIVKIGTLQTVEEAEHLLLALSQEENDT